MMHLLQRLDNESAGATTTVADTNSTDLALLLLKDSQQGDDDSGTACAKRVTEGDGTTVEVDFVLIDAEQLHVGESDNTESLVDLESVDLLLFDTGVLQSLGYGEGRRSGELGGVVRSLAPAQDLSNGLEVELLELGLGDKDNSGSTIRQRGGVGGSDSAVLGLEDGLQGLGLGLVELGELAIRELRSK